MKSKSKFIRVTPLVLIFFCFANTGLAQQKPAPPAESNSAPLSAEPSAPPATDEQDLIAVEQTLQTEKSDDTVPAVKLAPLKAAPVVDLQEVQTEKRKVETIVLQRNYLPKTERFQVFGGMSFLPTDVFYKTLGLQLRGAYHFTETWGVELMTLFLGSTRSAELNDVESKQCINGVCPNVESLVSPKNYYGLDIYYNSIYGKAAFDSRKIIPFEVYFTGGFGKMSTATSQNLTTLHLGMGQLFAVSRSNALRLDLSLLSYNSLTVSGDSQLTNNLLLTIGYGHFMPEAQYR